MKKLLAILAAVILVVLFASCVSMTVQRVSTDTVTDLSGRWNDTDAQLVSEQMVKEMLEKPWLAGFLKEHGKEPRIIVGTIENKSDEHIEIAAFRKDIENQLTNAGSVKFVMSKEEREEMRAEREDMQEYSSDKTKKNFKNETAADYMLKGVLTSIVDAVPGKKAVYYEVDLELWNTETNEKEWVGQKKIKKIIDRDAVGF